MKIGFCIAVVLSCVSQALAVDADAGPPFGQLKLVQEIDCGKPPDGGGSPRAPGPKAGPSASGQPLAALLFLDYPKGISTVETLLGKPCRVLPNDSGEAKYFAYRVGQGKGLKVGACYVLAVEFPEDKPRSLFICNWGCETARGVHTGNTVGDCVKGKYVNNSPESLGFPLSGGFTAWRQLFFLHDRFPEVKRPRGLGPRPLEPKDGFWVIVAQPRAVNAPKSAGAAVATIRLFEVPDPSRLTLKINYPPDGLPRRHLFWREEMADGVIAMGHKPEEKDETLRGVKSPTDWFEYKARLMQFLGMNTFSKDLLEFGHNQGWDSSPYGGNAWYNQSSTPKRWDEILTMLGKYGFDVFPYYEYAGSIGGDPTKAIGAQRRCMRLDGGKDYTHIGWVHKTNADLADPDFIDDAKKLLDVTIVRHKNKVKFLGAWFRPRPEANPISFNDKDLARFAKEANDGEAITRAHLQADKALLAKYYEWWFKKRLEFNQALCKYLRENVNPEAVFLYTTDSSEPGISLPASITAAGQKEFWKWKTVVVNDQPQAWADWLASVKEKDFDWVKSIAYDKVVKEGMYLKALLAKPGTWGKWEWQHAVPWADPQNYRAVDGVMLSYTFSRLYTVSSPQAFDAFRTPSGLAILRHYALNENEMHVDKDDLLGYFVADVERAGPYCMMGEARAMAYGDPRFIGYLVGNSFARGFPEYARRFNAAFLSLPALPSEVVADGASDPEVVVRRIGTKEHGTWLAVVNTALATKHGITVKVPPADRVTDASTGEPFSPINDRLALSLYPGQLVALHVR